MKLIVRLFFSVRHHTGSRRFPAKNNAKSKGKQKNENNKQNKHGTFDKFNNRKYASIVLSVARTHTAVC